MKLLLTINEWDVDSSVDENSAKRSGYKKREASRAVLFSPKGEVYLLHVTSHGYHKLPGGGIDPGEDKKEALMREIVEEVGYDSVVGEEVGEVVEYRHYFDNGLEQRSYAYIASQTGDLGAQQLEQGEIEEGHDVVIAKDLKEAVRIIKNDQPDNIEGRSIRLRDLTIFEYAQAL